MSVCAQLTHGPQFPWVDDVMYSVSTSRPVIEHVLRPHSRVTSARLVVVEMSERTDAMVVVEVRHGFKGYGTAAASGVAYRFAPLHRAQHVWLRDSKVLNSAPTH